MKIAESLEVTRRSGSLVSGDHSVLRVRGNPLRSDFRTRAERNPSFKGPRGTFLGVRSASEHLCVASVRGISGYPRADRRPPFRAERASSSRRPSPIPCQNGFILSCFASPPKSLRLPPWPFIAEWRRPAGVSSLFATSPAASTYRGHSQLPAWFRPRVFSTPRRFPPLPALRACFIPLPRPGFSVQGLLPYRSRRRLVATPSLRALFPAALTGCPVATRWSMDFEVLIRDPVRSPTCGD
jgi:hypothetical protein